MNYWRREVDVKDRVEEYQMYADANDDQLPGLHVLASSDLC